jgi:hypothetical protein
VRAEREREPDPTGRAAVVARPQPAPPAPTSAAGVMALQRLVGNAAMAEILGEQGAGLRGGPAAGITGLVPDATAGAGEHGAAEGAAANGAATGLAAADGVAEGAAEGASAAAPAGPAAAEGVAEGAAGAAEPAAGGIFDLIARGEAAVGAAAGSVWELLTGGAARQDGAAGEDAGQVAAGGAAGAAAGAAPDAEAGGGGAAGGAGGAPGAAAGAAGAAGAAPAAAQGSNAAGGGAAGAAAAGAAGGGAAGAGAAGAAQGAKASGGPAGAAAAGAPQAAPAGAAAAAGGAAGAAEGVAEAAPKREPGEDPNFQAMKGAAVGAAGKAKAHQPAGAGAAAAQAAALPPGNEAASQAQGAQVEEMGKQQPGVFDRAAFIAAVKKAIDKAAPKNLEEADDFKGSGKAGEAKTEVQSLVKGGKKDAEKDIKQATDAPPDTSKATPKQVTPLTPDEPGAPTASVGAASAMPGPRPPEDTDLSEGPKQVDQQMADAEVTEEQLQKSNEPDFNAALDARQEAKDHATTAPAEYRAQETEILGKGRAEAAQVEGVHLKGMHGAKLEAIAKVAGHKGETKSQDETKRAKVAADIQAIYDRTKTEVTGILDALDGKVEATFTRGEASARKQFEDYVGAKMDAYKDDRYSGWFGGARWLKDKLFGMPDEVNVFYTQGRDGYLTAMDGVIGEVADLVGNELNAARMKIAAGRAEVHDYVTQLPQDLQKVGKDAEAKLADQWDGLEGDIDSKQEAMVDSLAQKYVASRDALDDRIEELKAANKGLVAKAIDAVVGVVKTILKLKDMLLNVLAKAASVIGDIITDPIGFLSNLVDGIKTGLSNFVGNIVRHLEEGFLNWLFGALGDAGITLPKTFDLEGIFGLVMDVLGLSYRSIRGRVAKIVGEPVVSRMEQTVDVFKILVSKGVGGLWEWIKDKIGDFQDLVFGGIKDFIIERVIKGGVMWLLGLLNPAAAFIKACQAIYNIVMFIVERGAQVMDFVNSVLDSIGAIAKGNISAAAQKVEDALAKALPLAIGFLASLLNIGGVTDKIREGIDKVRKPIEKAVDFVVLGAVKGFKKLFGGAIGWVKGKYEKGKQFVKDKATAVKEWGAGKVRGAVGWVKSKFGFKMADEAHELSVEPGPPAQIVMASQRGPLVQKLNRELALVQGRPEQVAAVQALLDQVAAIPDEVLNSPDAKPQVDRLVNALSVYGRTYHVPDLGVERREGDEDLATLCAQARTARTRANAELEARGIEGKAVAVGGSVVRVSGWGSEDSADLEMRRKALETKQALFEVGDRQRRALWEAREIRTGPGGQTRERRLLPTGMPEPLEESFARWDLETDADQAGEPVPDAALPTMQGPQQQPLRATRAADAMSSRDQQDALLRQGWFRHTYMENGQEWTREVRLGAPGDTPERAFVTINNPFEQGEAGKFSAAHAEKQVHNVTPGVPIGIAGSTSTTRVVCGDCRAYFRAEAMRLRQDLVIAEEGDVLVFRQDGNTVDVVPG